MKFRRTKVEDIKEIMAIITQAQEYLKSQNIDQWQNNYPNPQSIQNDIENGYGFVLEEDGKIIATSAISFDPEPTYKEIYEGQWLSSYDYAVVHRVAVDGSQKGKGISSIIMKEVERLCHEKGVKSIKVDTHEKNFSMQRLLLKNDYTQCGVIYLDDGAKRIAFEKIMSE